MTKEILNVNRERLGHVVRGVAERTKRGYETVGTALSAFALVDASQVTTTTSLLNLEPWEIAVGKGIVAAGITGYYLMTTGAQLHTNEGRTRFQKCAVNLGLALGAPAVAFTDYLLIFRAPF